MNKMKNTCTKKSPKFINMTILKEWYERLGTLLMWGSYRGVGAPDLPEVVCAEPTQHVSLPIRP